MEHVLRLTFVQTTVTNEHDLTPNGTIDPLIIYQRNDRIIDKNRRIIISKNYKWRTDNEKSSCGWGDNEQSRKHLNTKIRDCDQLTFLVE